MASGFVDAALRDDWRKAERLLGAGIPSDLAGDPQVLALARNRLQADPGYGPWAPRAIILAAASAPIGPMIGHVGFHTRPGPGYLNAIAPGAVELGYTVFGPHRRQGFAREALTALMDWAVALHGVPGFVASVSPANAPSLRLIAGFGFVKVAEQTDERDGAEHVFLRDCARG